MINHYTVAIATSAGGAGSNLVNGRCQWNGVFNGKVLGFRLEYHASADAGTDVTITEPSGLKRTFVNAANNNASKNIFPVQPATDNAGGNISGHYYDAIGVDSSNLLVSVAEAGAALNPAVTVIIQVDDGG